MEHALTAKIPLMFGEILVRGGIISEDVLRKALERQTLGDKREVGRILSEDFGIALGDIHQALCQYLELVAAGVMEKRLREQIASDANFKDDSERRSITKMIEGMRVTVRYYTAHWAEEWVRYGQKFERVSRDREVVSLKGRMEIGVNFVRLAKIAGKVSFTCSFVYDISGKELHIDEYQPLTILYDALTSILSEHLSKTNGKRS